MRFQYVLGYFTFPVLSRLFPYYTTAVLNYFAFPSSCYVITAVLAYFTFTCSYYIITLLRLYLAILHSLVLVALLRYYGCTRLFYISFFVYFITLLWLYSAILHFLVRITLLRCYGCTRLFYISFFLLLDYIVTAVLSYFTFPCSYYFITLLWLYLAILDFLVLITLLCCDGCTRLFYISLFLFLYCVVTAVLSYFSFPCSYYFITLLGLYLAILHLFVRVSLE